MIEQTVANERQRLEKLAFIDVQKFWTEMLVVFKKFRDREQEEFADSLGFAIRVVVTDKDSLPIPESEFTIEYLGSHYGAPPLGHAALRDGRQLMFLGRNSTATRTFEGVFSDYASVAGDNLPDKWESEIKVYSNPEARWLSFLFLREKLTEDHTWDRPIRNSVDAVKELIAGASTLLDSRPAEPRVRVDIENCVVTVDAVPYRIEGSKAVASRVAEFMEALVRADGEVLSMTDFQVRTRDMENQCSKINKLVERQPGGGCRIPREKLRLN